MDARKGRWQPRAAAHLSIPTDLSLSTRPFLPTVTLRCRAAVVIRETAEGGREATHLIREQPCDVGADGRTADGADEGGSDNAMFGSTETIELQIPNIR